MKALDISKIKESILFEVQSRRVNGHLYQSELHIQSNISFIQKILETLLRKRVLASVLRKISRLKIAQWILSKINS